MALPKLKDLSVFLKNNKLLLFIVVLLVVILGLSSALLAKELKGKEGFSAPPSNTRLKRRY